VHSIKGYAFLASSYANLVATEHETEMRIFDVTESLTDPQKVLGGYPPSGMTEFYLTAEMLIVFGAVGTMWRAKYDGSS